MVHARMWRTLFAVPVAVSLGLAAQAPSFAPQGTLDGRTLAQWTHMGAANWAAQGAEIVVTGGPGALVSKASMQDAAMYLQFRCEGPCDAGVLLRIQRHAHTP